MIGGMPLSSDAVGNAECFPGSHIPRNVLQMIQQKLLRLTAEFSRARKSFL